MTTQFRNQAVDPPLAQNAPYRLDAVDREYIDEQIREIQKFLVAGAANGMSATYALVDASSPALNVGDVVCTKGILNGAPTITLATGAALAIATDVFGIVLVASPPGVKALVATSGLIPASITGLPAGTARARVNQTTGRAESVGTYSSGDVAIGTIDPAGTLTFTHGAGGVISGTTKQAFTVSAATAGQVAVPANDGIDPTHVTVATATARANSNMATGIYVASYSATTMATLAEVGDRIAISLLGLAPPPASLPNGTYAVADASGNAVRKDVPDPGDLILGLYDDTALNFFPTVSTSGTAGPLNPSHRGATDFSAPVGDALQRRIEAAFLPAANFALPRASKRIEIEPGWFQLDHPLQVWRGAVDIRGVLGCTHLYAQNWAGPVIHVSSRREPPFLAFNDFAGGNAMVLDPHADLNDDHWLELSEYGAGVAVDTWAQFEVDFVIKKTQAGTYGYGGTVISSGGSRYASDPGDPLNDTTLQCAFTIHLTSGTDGSSANSVFFQLVTYVAGVPTKLFMFAPANSLTADGNYHRVKCNYDGSNMRIIVDNVVVATAAKTGAVAQKPWEHVNIGRGIAYHFNTSWETSPPYANLACIQVRDTVSQTTSGTLTLPTTKFTYPPTDTHVTLALNFDDFYPPVNVRTITNATNTSPVVLTLSTPHTLDSSLTSPVTVYGVGGTTSVNFTWDFPTVVDATHVSIPIAGNGAYTSGGKLVWGGSFTKGWVRAAGAGTSQIQAFFPTYHDDPARSVISNVQIQGLTISSFYGDALLYQSSPEAVVRDVTCNTKGGIRMRDNCYEFLIERCNVSGSGALADVRTKCLAGPAGYMGTIRQSSFSSGGTGIVAVAADISIYGVYLVACWRASMFYNANTVSWYGMTSISDESAVVGKTDDLIALIAVANAHISGVQITTSAAAHCIVVDQVHTGALAANVTSLGCTFAAVSPDAASRTIAGLIVARAGHGNPFKGSITVGGHTQVGTLTIPWVDPATEPTYPILIDPRGRIGTTSISIAGLTAYAMTRDDALFATVIFTGALTSDCAVTVGPVNLGPRSYINATTGGHNVTLKTTAGSNVLTLAVSPAATPVRFDGTDVRSP